MKKGLFDLSDKVAIVTGGGRGLGRSIALALAEHGADVVVVSRTRAEVEKVANEISEMGRRSLPLAMDTSRRIDVERMVERTLEGWGQIDVLVNNAGIVVIKPAVDYTEDDWDQVLDIDLKGYFLCAQAVGQVMVRQGRGSIIMNSSVAGSVGIAQLAPYAAAKGGVNQLTRSLAVEWAPFGVRVNALAPSYFDSVMRGAQHTHDEGKARWIRERTPLGRRGTPDELAGPAVFLASEASSYVTGQILMIDGGWTAA